MARLIRSSRTGEHSLQKLTETEPKLVAFQINNPPPCRQLSLLTITIILNTLLWSSVFCTVIALFQIASDSDDASNILPGVLTLVAAIVTILYTIIHTAYSIKQRTLTYQQLDPSTIKKTTYIANRLVVSLCVLWLLTAGWNMILVARRPICLHNQLGGQSWEAGITCLVSRVGMALAMIALIGSLALFGMMAAVRRPFEAHLFKYGQREPRNNDPTPPSSRRPSEDRGATEKLVADNGMIAYSHTRSMSNLTNGDVETLDLNASRPASIVQPPSPTRDRAGLGVFTSPLAPPPLPPAFMVTLGSPSLQTLPPPSDPFAHRRRLSLTPRTDALLAPAAYVPYSIPIEFSASAQRAVYPDNSAPYRSVSACRSQPHLRSMSSFSNRRYSRSTVSLSRPHRISSLTAIPHLECSSRSETLKSSEGISEKGESPNSKSSTSSTTKRASTAEIAYAIAYNTPIPGTEPPRRKHGRTVSAPNTMAGVQAPQSGERMAMGWKPNLEKSKTVVKKPLPTHFERLVRSASAELLGRFGPLAKDEEKKWKKEFELEMDMRLNAMSKLPFSERKSMSTDAETLRESYDAGSLDEEVRFEDAKEVLVVRPVSQDIAFL